ncbi:FAD-binding oxidoreductase [Galactobacter sp.]|mgnify:CR=1 FL=1|uniref:NAD(P)/FAD-dependent oxidoreductase n=1 Tax=Galactobacter sp. TaxID=2676125 RepID=UPI0025C47B24|nr:FAD-binding oxidoreductase [Galactobacter sp.]
MSTPHQAPDHVIVIGGGIFGASTTEQLARKGVRTTWVTSGTLADGASGRTLAWLNSAGFRSEPYHRIRLEGISRWRDFAARVPGSQDYLRFHGGLTWAKPGQSHKERYRYERAHDYVSAWLSPEQVPGTVAAVDPAAVDPEGAIFNADEGWVDLPSVIAELRTEIETYGVTEIIENAGRCVPVVEGGRAVGVLTGTGQRIDADAVVLATGPQTPGILDELKVPMGDDSPAAFVAFTKPLDHGLTSVLNTPRVAIRPAVDGGLVMDSGWSERAMTVDEDGTPHVSDEVVTTLLQEATAVLAGHPELELDHIGMGYKPIPGDGEPVIGETDDVAGLYVAFSHSGATQGLVMGELIADEVVGGQVSELTLPFRPGRYKA